MGEGVDRLRALAQLEVELIGAPAEAENLRRIERYVALVQEVRAQIRIPFAVKLSPCFTALPNLAQLVQQGSLSAPQFERVLVSLPGFAQLGQPDILSPEQVNQLLAAAEQLKTLAADQIHQVLARLPDLIEALGTAYLAAPNERVSRAIKVAKSSCRLRTTLAKRRSASIR